MLKARDHRRSGAGRVLREAGVILTVTLILALAAWLLRDPRLPLVADVGVYEFEIEHPLLTAEEALRFYEEGSHLFIDTREPALEGMPHLPGAMQVRPARFDDDLRAIIDFIFPEDPLILYGDGLQATAAVAGRFTERGYEQVSLLGGGLRAWRKAGGPVEEPTGGTR